MISVDVIPLAVVYRARLLLRASDDSRADIVARTGISLSRLDKLGAPMTDPLSMRVPAVRYLRAVRGLPAHLSDEEKEHVRSAVRTMLTDTRDGGSCSAFAKALGVSKSFMTRLLSSEEPPSVLLWAALFPAAIECEDIIATPKLPERKPLSAKARALDVCRRLRDATTDDERDTAIALACAVADAAE